MFKKLLKGIGAVAKVAPVLIPIARPEVLINTVVAAGVKHLTKIDNQAIPGLNVLGSTATLYVKTGLATGNWGVENLTHSVISGTLLTGGSTATHQGVKILSKRFISRSI